VPVVQTGAVRSAPVRIVLGQDEGEILRFETGLRGVPRQGVKCN